MKLLDAFTGSIAKWFSLAGLREMFGDSVTDTVTTKDALSLPAIWNGVSRIAGHISQLPLNVYEAELDEDGEKKSSKKTKTHTAYKLMMRRPNAYQTPVVFKEQLSLHSLLEGNGRAALVRSGTRITEMIPLLPHCTMTCMIAGTKYHVTRPPADDRLRQFFESTSGGKDDGIIVLEDREVLHFIGLSSDGVSGIALKDIGKRNLGAAIAAEKRLTTQLQKGFSGNLFLEAPVGMFKNQADAEQFLDAVEKRHNSPDKAGKIALLREGLKANLVTMNNRDAEMDSMRKFARQDQALWLGLEQILGDDSSVSYNSLEQKLLAYLMNCLNRWLTRIEQECEFKLLSTRDFDSERYYMRFNTAALLKSDYKTTVESLAAAIAATIISPNEAREKLDMNPREGGDEYSNPAITPGDVKPKKSGDDTEESSSSPRNQSAVSVLLNRLVKIECQRASDAASKSRNFCDWIDKWYAKWETKLADDIEQIGGDRQLATDHCEESKRQLLDCAGSATQETLACDVQKCVANWQYRVSALVEEMELMHV